MPTPRFPDYDARDLSERLGHNVEDDNKHMQVGPLKASPTITAGLPKPDKLAGDKAPMEWDD